MACSRWPLIIGAPQVRHPGAHTMLIKGLSGRLAMGAPRVSLVKEPGALFVKANFKPYPGQLGVRFGQAEDFVGSARAGHHNFTGGCQPSKSSRQAPDG